MKRMLSIKATQRWLLAPLGANAWPAGAHFTAVGAPHAHTGDAAGLLAVAVLVGTAAWLDRRRP